MIIITMARAAFPDKPYHLAQHGDPENY